jgi:isopenicillin N synthase-like dioxygenase
LIGSSVTIFKYPHIPSADPRDVRAGAHSDYGSVTLLFRLPGQPGLEILTKDSQWVPVPVSPPGTEDDPCPPILLNIGDLLSYWTGGLLRSVVHRVVFPKPESRGEKGQDSEGAAEDRYSIAYFCHPSADTLLVPVPSEMVQAKVGGAGDGHGGVLTAGQYLESRLEATYGYHQRIDASKNEA